jgi:hypothetical protein
MERLALLLINGRGVPQRDAQRAVQLMLHALSHISSGQAKISGVQALLKQLVLSYRIVFLRLCEFLRARLSWRYVHRAAVRVRDRIKSMHRHGQGQGQDRFRYPSDDSKASTALHCTAVQMHSTALLLLLTAVLLLLCSSPLLLLFYPYSELQHVLLMHDVAPRPVG